MVEYYLDLFEQDPLAVHRGADGEVQLTDTGDTLIDSWEQEIATGAEPNLWDAFNPEAKKALEARMRKKNPFINPNSSISEVVDAVNKRDRQERGHSYDPANSTHLDPAFALFGNGED